MEAYRKRWENLVFEMTQRVQSETTIIETLREQGDANFLVHQGRLLELQDLQRRMEQLAANFPEEEDPTPTTSLFGTPIPEATMAEIISRVRQSLGERNLNPEHESFDDIARSLT